MHFYQFHIGDYKSHTHHLSPMEDLAYRRLLDHYYLHEEPIRQHEIARQIGMRDHEQDVLTVLDEFFVSTPAGYINPRADNEIAKYRKLSEDGKRGAAKRWAKAEAQPDQKGGHREAITLPSATPIATNNQEPITKNHSIPPAPKGEYPRGFEQFWSAYPKKVGKDAAASAFAKRKVGQPLLNEMLMAIEKQAASGKWLEEGGRFVPNPATWLNQGRWKDEVAADEQELSAHQKLMKGAL